MLLPPSLALAWQSLPLRLGHFQEFNMALFLTAFGLVGLGGMCFRPYAQVYEFNSSTRSLRYTRKLLFRSRTTTTSFSDLIDIVPVGRAELRLVTLNQVFEIACTDANEAGSPTADAIELASQIHEVLGVAENGLGQPTLDASAAARQPGELALTTRLGNAGFRVLRDDPEVLILQTRDVILPSLVGIYLTFQTVNPLLKARIGRITWESAFWSAGIFGGTMVILLCLRVYERQFVFAREAARFMILCKRPFFTSTTELAFADVQDVRVTLRPGTRRFYCLNLRTKDGRTIDLTPNGFSWTSGDKRSRCEEMAAILTEVFQSSRVFPDNA